MTNEPKNDLDITPDAVVDSLEATPPLDRQIMLNEFKKAYNWNPTPELNKKLILEEAAEVREAILHLIKEMVDLEYVMIGAYVSGNVKEAFTEEVLNEVRKVEFLYDLVNHDVFSEAFRRVHESNMSKLGADGKPIYRADGKILKGPNYKEPNFEDLI